MTNKQIILEKLHTLDSALAALDSYIDEDITNILELILDIKADIIKNL